jgi:heat shock protein HslJ
MMCVAITGCSSDSPSAHAVGDVSGGLSAPQLLGTPWRCTALSSDDGTPLTIPERAPTLTFESDDRVAGFAGVNRFFGAVAFKNAANSSVHFDISGIGATRMAGTPELMRFESVFLSMLDATDSYTISDGGELMLSVKGTTRARFNIDSAR